MKDLFNWNLPLSMSKEERKIQGISQTLTKLYRCRDLEISNLWQRSVFLAVFLTLAISAYGFLFSKLLEKDCIYWNNIPFNIGAISLSIIGLTFSVIWILMGKASKAWYEVYENAITIYEKKYWQELGIPSNNQNKDTDFRMGTMHPKEIVNNLTSSKAGAYSPSKLNIIIGQVFWLLWVIIYVVHTFIVSYVIVKNVQSCDNLYIQLFIAIISSGSVYFVVLVINKILKRKGQSSFLNGE